MATPIFHHSRPALCGSSGRAWSKASSWPGVPEPNRCKRCSAIAAETSARSEPAPGPVTITDSERVVWTGPYAEFQANNLDSLSVTEFCALLLDGEITTGGGAAPLLIIRCDSRKGRVAPLNSEKGQ